MKKIKVAFFADMLIENFDGAARTIFKIIRSIDSDKFDYLFICGDAPKANFPHEFYSIPSFDIPHNEDYKIAIPALAFFEMNAVLDKFKADVIHTSSPSFLGKYALDYGHSKNIPVLSIYHTHFISYVDYYLKNVKLLIEPVKAFVINRNRAYYNGCDLTLVPSQSLMQTLESYGFDSAKMRLWRRGMNTQMFSPDKRNETLRSHQKPMVLFVSRLVWEKNLDTLIKIYILNESQNCRYQIIVAGDGVAKEELRESMPNAKFLGNVPHEELSEWYASSDVFLFTSDTETYGNVVVEAMASGLPVVVADAGGPKDIVVHGFNGLKCKPDDETAFHQSILQILDDEILKNKMVSNAIEFAKSMNWDVLTNEYFGMIRALAEKRGMDQ